MACLNEFNDLIKSEKRITEAHLLMSKHHVSNGTFLSAVIMGYFEALGNRVYKSNVIEFKSEETFKVIAETRRRAYDSTNRNGSDKSKQIQENFITIPETKAEKQYKKLGGIIVELSVLSDEEIAYVLNYIGYHGSLTKEIKI
jgi:hypothetical protein